MFAWLIDMLLIGLIVGALWFVLLLFGLLTLGFGLRCSPCCRSCRSPIICCSSPVRSATLGQQALGLVVRRNDDLGRPSALQALIYTLLFYLTLATTGLLLLVALFTIRQRALHDLASGLVVIRAIAERALTRGVGSWNMQGGSPYA